MFSFCAFERRCDEKSGHIAVTVGTSAAARVVLHLPASSSSSLLGAPLAKSTTKDNKRALQRSSTVIANHYHHENESVAEHSGETNCLGATAVALQSYREPTGMPKAEAAAKLAVTPTMDATVTPAAGSPTARISRDSIDASPFRVPKGLWCYRLDQDRVVLGGSLTDGGSVFEWLRSTLGIVSDEDLDATMRRAREMPPASHDLMVRTKCLSVLSLFLLLQFLMNTCVRMHLVSF